MESTNTPLSQDVSHDTEFSAQERLATMPRLMGRSRRVLDMTAYVSDQRILIESLYIVAYFVIIGVALNTVLLVARPNLKLFRDYDNMWVRLLYWPVIWLTLFVVTVLTFYA